jgi:hypothetical protein
VRVTEGVAVGSTGVSVGVSVKVAVGAVEVGKGPRRAPDVIASAVLVPFAILCASAPVDGTLKASQSANSRTINITNTLIACR